MITDEDLDALEAKAREVKRRADAIMDTDDYRASYALVLHELAQVGEEMPEIADVALAACAEVRRLRALTAPSPPGTVRLLYPDGSHRDVDPEEPLPIPHTDRGEAWQCRIIPEVWSRMRRKGEAIAVALDWDAEHGSDIGEFVEVQIETFEQEAARERSARLEAERQLDEVRSTIKVQRGLIDKLGEENDALRARVAELEGR